MVAMFRAIFLLLVLVNLLFFAWGQGYFRADEEGHEPQRLASQLAPEKLLVTDTAPPPVALPVTENTCRMISGLSLEDAQRLHERLSALAFAIQPVEVPPGHWVFLPPAPSKAAAEKKLADLKRRGIANYFLVLDEGIDKLAISLGMFNNQKAAEEYLHVLAGKGIKSAMMQLRRRPAEKAQLEVRGPQDQLLNQLPELLSGMDKAVIAECSEAK